MIVPASWMDWTVAVGALATVGVFAILGYRAFGDHVAESVEVESRDETDRSEPRRAA